MSISYDKKRKKYYARITLDGKRRFLGYRDTEREAERDYDREEILHESRKRMSESMKRNYTLANYQPEYEEDNVSIGWLQPHKQLKLVAGRIRVAFMLAVLSRRRK